MRIEVRGGGHAAWRLAAAALLSLAVGRGSGTAAPPPPAPGLAAGDAAYAVTVLSTREVPNAESPSRPVEEVVLQVVAKGSAKPPRTIVFGGPQEYVRESLRELKVASGQLLAVTDCSFAVFDLKTGKKRAHVYSSCNIAVSPDGERVAYVERRLQVTPPPAAGSVIRVLDVVPLATHTVFPEASRVSAGGGGLLSTWDDDLGQVHSAGAMHWSPDGSKLLFFCIHGLATAGAPGQESRPFLVVVDLRDLAHSHFVHQPIAKDRYLLAGAELPKDRRVLFRPQGVEWLDGGAAVRVIPMPDAPWMRRDIVFNLPAAG